MCVSYHKKIYISLTFLRATMIVLKKYCLFIFIFMLVNQALAQGFVQNNGQLENENGASNNNILYYFNSGNFRVHLNKNGFSYELIKKQCSDFNEDNIGEAPVLFDFNRVDIIFENQSFTGNIETENLLFVEKFYRGEKFIESQVYQKITYKEIYPKIDVVFYANPNGFKYDFVVHPGGDINNILLNFKSPFQTYLSEGAILVDMPLNRIQEFVPLSFFLNSNQKIQVDFAAIKHDGLDNFFQFNTACGKTQFAETLVIDPMPNLWFGTYISGNLDEYPQNVTVDEQGNIYVVGFTNSVNNIGTSGAFQGTFEAVFDAFLVKYDSEGVKIWGTYIGGNSVDRAYGITSQNGYLYICGNSFSSDFATPGVHQTVNINSDDGFLAKFDYNGSRIWCTYYGGELHDFAESVVIDNQNNIYITGHTRSFTNIATLDAHQESFFGVSAGFLAKFSDQGQLTWGTYYGSSFQEAYGLTLDSDQNIIFAGFTTSSSGIASPGAYQTVLGGNMDAFLAKFNPAGQRLWGTYFGGPADDFGYDVCVDATNNIYLMGNTSSAENISFGSGYQLQPGSVDDGFVAKFTALGNVLWSTYVGGSEAEYLKAIEPFYEEGVIVVGKTQSNNGIATPYALVSSLQGEYDALLMKISASGELQWGTYYGGNLSEEFTGVAIRSSNTYIHAVGFTQSENGIATLGADQTQTFGGMFNGFLTQFCAPVVPNLVHNIVSVVCDNNTYTVGVSPNAFSNYQWSTGSILPQIVLDDLLVGNFYEYYVNTIDTNNCAFHSDTLSFEVFSGFSVEIDASALTVCAFEDVTFSVSNAYETYIWSTGGSSPVELFQFQTEGNVSVTVQVLDENGCVAEDEVFLTVLSTPEMPELIFSGSTNFCIGETLEVSTSQPYYAYLWSTGSIDPQIELNAETWLSLTVFNASGCSNFTDPILIGSSVLEPIIVMESDAPICFGDKLLFAVYDNFDMYSWSNGSTQESTSLAAQAGTNWIAIEVGSICDAVGFDTFYYFVPEPIDAVILVDLPTQICVNSELLFSLSGDWNNVLWQNSIVGFNYTSTPSDFGPWEVVVQAIDLSGCTSYDTLLLNVEDCHLGVYQDYNELLLYPNPFQNDVNISTDFHIKHLEIYDVAGKLVYSTFLNYSQLTTINLGFLENGTYHVVLFNEFGHKYAKILLKLNPIAE